MVCKQTRTLTHWQLLSKCTLNILPVCKNCIDMNFNLCLIISFSYVFLQVLGKVPTISIDKTDGCQMYLSAESLGVELITSKSSEMNVLVPKPNGDYVSYSSINTQINFRDLAIFTSLCEYILHCRANIRYQSNLRLLLARTVLVLWPSILLVKKHEELIYMHSLRIFLTI